MFLHLIDRNTARAYGLKRFYTGRPCSRGGLAPRQVSNGSCNCHECLFVKSQNHLLYRMGDNRQRLLDAKRADYQANADKYCAEKKAKRAANPKPVKDPEIVDRVLFLHLIKRKTAMAAGLKFYYQMTPCPLGNFALRRTYDARCMCIDCVSIEAARRHRYVAENIETVRDSNRRSIIKNRDKIRKRLRDRYSKNPEKYREMSKAWQLQNLEKFRVYNRKHRERFGERVKALGRASYYRNIEKHRERGRAYTLKNRDKILERCRDHYSRNKTAYMVRSAQRRAIKRQRIPSWYSEFDTFVLSEAVELCNARIGATGIDWHVDHMIPLQARKASGLHCAHNLQVIPGFMNLRKCNRMVLTQPDEWIANLPVNDHTVGNIHKRCA